MLNTNNYTLALLKNDAYLNINIKALDTNHAQAQSWDILRALDAHEFKLKYETCKETSLSLLFEKLTYNKFKHNCCELWEKKYTNNCPCIYLFSKRFYVKDIILKYLDIPKGKLTTKLKCKNKQCINPYHFEYHISKNSKLTCGDTKLLLAYRGQGTGVNQIAEALNVHRSTIYRKLKNERLSFGSANHSRS